MISVVTVCFNDLSGLKTTKESVLKQGGCDYEWIVVDGGSNDGSADYLSSLGPQVIFISEPDNGIYDAMRKGLRLASRPYILFLNAGDEFLNSESLDSAMGQVGSEDVYFFATQLEGWAHHYRRTARTLPAARYSVPAVQQSTIYSTSILRSLEWPTTYSICGDFYIAAQLHERRCSWKRSDLVLSRFKIGGISTLAFPRLCVEAWRIQRDVLHIPAWIRMLFLLRRFCTGAVMFAGYKLRKVLRRVGFADTSVA